MRKLAVVLLLSMVGACGGVPVYDPPPAVDGGSCDAGAARDMASITIYIYPTCRNEPNYIRQNCIGEWNTRGEPCAVCVGYQGCIWPGAAAGLGVYCTNELGCADPVCRR